MSAGLLLKKTLRRPVRAFFRALPLPWGLRLARIDRRLFNQLPPGHSLRYDRYHGDLSVQLDTTYPIERQMLSGEYDPETAHVMRTFVEPGDVCIDVGANVGAHVLLLAKLVAPTGHVYAFEPGPPIFERLKINLALNPGLSGLVTPERLGISDTKGKLFWNEDMGNRGNAHLRSTAGIEVPVTTLDEYFARHRPPGRISFMKVDVEGMEYEVLNGAVGLLARDHPILYFETLRGMREIVIKRSGKDPFAVLQNLLLPLGYALFRINGHQRRLAKVSVDQLGENTLALHATTSQPDALR